MIPYRLAPRAQNDLDEIWSYVADDSPASADRLVDVFHRQFLLLSSQPHLGEARPQLAANMRSFCTGSYVILYRLTRSGIEVARVIHAARDIGAQF